MIDRVGQQLGNYRLIRLLGRGGFAEVYLGEHMRLRTQAAIKILYAHLADHDVENFLAEARTIANLEHPHIVRVLDFDVQDGTAFLVMSYAPHGNLRQYHPKGSRLPLNTIVDYVKQVADALQYAHNEKVIHRDIKPENMLIGRHGEVLLSDFGLALIAQSSRLQSTHEVIGTAHYMAPEQLQGKPRLASDQYALGIVVYEWLTRNPPFHGTFTELYSQHIFVFPTPLREKVPTIPPEIEQVVLIALEKDPRKRFASVRAFATALEQAYQATLIRPVSFPSTIAPSSQPSLLGGAVTEVLQSQSLIATNVITPRNQSSQPTNIVTPPGRSSQSTDSSSIPTLHKSVPSHVLGQGDQQGAARQPRHEYQTPALITNQAAQVNKNPSPQTPIPVTLPYRRPGFSPRTTLMLVGLALLMIISSAGLFAYISNSYSSRNNAIVHSTPNIQATHHQAFATDTALVQANTQATATSAAQANAQVAATAAARATTQAQAAANATATSQAQVIPNPTPTPQPQVIPNPTPTPRPHPIPSPTPKPRAQTGYPHLKSEYSGTVTNTSHGITATLTLSSIQQSQQNISGYCAKGSPLNGSGPFSGTIDASGNVQFTVVSGNVTTYFSGTLSNGVMQGTYTANGISGEPSQQGVWSVS